MHYLMAWIISWFLIKASLKLIKHFNTISIIFIVGERGFYYVLFVLCFHHMVTQCENSFSSPENSQWCSRKTLQMLLGRKLSSCKWDRTFRGHLNSLWIIGDNFPLSLNAQKCFSHLSCSMTLCTPLVWIRIKQEHLF